LARVLRLERPTIKNPHPQAHVAKALHQEMSNGRVHAGNVIIGRRATSANRPDWLIGHDHFVLTLRQRSCELINDHRFGLATVSLRVRLANTHNWDEPCPNGG